MSAATFSPTAAPAPRSASGNDLPGDAAGVETPASNDRCYRQVPVWRLALTVLADAFAGAVLLALLIHLPVVLGVIWGR